MKYLELITKIIKSKGINAKISLDSNLKSLGVDSLLAMEVVVELESSLGIMFDDSSLMSIKTVGDLANQVEKLKK
jgi:acyl carrier protein